MAERVHILKRWPCGGGMERIARIHLERGEPLIAMSGDGTPEPGVVHLDLRPGTRIRECRRRLMEAMARYPGGNFLHYNGYAMDWLDVRDEAARHLMYLHSDYPGLGHLIRALRPFAGGILCVNDSLAAAVLKCLRRDQRLPVRSIDLPVQLPPQDLRNQPKPRPPVIGFSGRVQVLQKRLDRLPAFLDTLEGKGVDYRMEILGDGPYLEPLRQKLGRRGKVRFLEYLRGEDYQRAILSWTYILFLSDYEGLPLSLVEGVAAGAIPVYPDFHEGKDWVAGLSPDFLYPMGDVEAAAEVVARIEHNWVDPDRAAYREKSWNAIGARSIPAYLDAFSEHMHALTHEAASLTVCGKPVPRWYPLWMYHRRLRIRQLGLAGYFRAH